MDTHERSDLRRRVATVLRGDALFSTMSTDFPLRQRFISNAAQALSDDRSVQPQALHTHRHLLRYTRPVAASVEEMSGFAIACVISRSKR